MQFDAVPEVADLEAQLEARSKPELIALIKQMLLRGPDLAVLLETPLPVPGERREPVDPDVYRRQAADAFDSLEYNDYNDYYYSGSNAASGLAPIVAKRPVLNSDAEARIWTALETVAASMDDLCARVSMPVTQCITTVTDLELRGIVECELTGAIRRRV